MPNRHPPHDLLQYHRSITDELHSLKNRIRNLVRHWPTDGEHKEVALRAVLRRHLPQSLNVGRGFIVNQHESSRQIDVLVTDSTKPALFRDGDLTIVTPEAVRGLIEVKTECRSRGCFEDALSSLAANVKMWMRGRAMMPPWSGLFVYDGNVELDVHILSALRSVYESTEVAINCVAWGKTGFIRFWESRSGPTREEVDRNPHGRWCSYQLDRLAPSYFIGNLLIDLARDTNDVSNFAWFPLVDGKEQHKRYEIGCREEQPRRSD